MKRNNLSVCFITVFLFAFFQPFLHSAFADTVSIDKYIKDLKRQISKEKIKCEPSNEAPFLFGEAGFKLDKKTCKNLTAESACKALKEKCKSIPDTRYCNGARYQYSSAHGESRENSIYKKRFDSLCLRLQIANHAKQYFDLVVKTPWVQNMCCASKSARDGVKRYCPSIFESTELLIEKNDWDDANRTHATESWGTPQVIVSQSKLVEYYTQEGLEQLLAHELGHTCQTSRRYSQSYGTLSYAAHLWRVYDLGVADACGYRDAGDELKDIYKDFNEVSGKGLLQCLRKSINLDELESGSEFGLELGTFQACHWAREAFADVVFYYLRPSITHWIMTCAGPKGGDGAHGPPRPILDCILKHTDLKTSLCE